MPQLDIPQSVLDWLAKGERGTSSETIVAFLWKLPITGRWGMTHPLDPSDLRRCLLLLQASPETRARLPEMNAVSPEWRGLVERWDELERMFLEEAGYSLHHTNWSAPRTFAAMQAIEDSAQQQKGSD